MSGFNGYDQWLTTHPDEDYDDEHCEVCGMELGDEPEAADKHEDDSEEYNIWYNGFCSSACQDGHDYWQELVHASDPGVATPKLWRPDVVRPLFEFLCAELGRGTEGGEHNVESWSKSIYKGTGCGAWLNIDGYKTVTIGSIVEGVDECAETQFVEWPFTSEKFWSAVQAVEDDCTRIWNDTHGCDDCFEYPEDELHPVDPDCKSCKGAGRII